jgi:oligopeptide transport system substrate-binding protein
VPRSAIEKYADRWLMIQPLPVSGAYQLEYWRLNDKIRLRKNSRYWDAANTRCDVVDLIPCTSATTALNLYQTGAADIVWDKELIPSDLLDVLLGGQLSPIRLLGHLFLPVRVTRPATILVFAKP